MRRLLAVGLWAMPALAWANMVWPALYLETRLFTGWAITLGLVVEYLFIRHLFRLSPWRALQADLAANAVSALAGVVLIPLGGVAWELFPGALYMWALDWGTFNPITWAGTFLLACLINASLEGAVYKRAFKVALPFRSRQFGGLVLANAVSVGAALASLWVVPVRP